jgi:Domain of unknown function (DUF4292)
MIQTKMSILISNILLVSVMCFSSCSTQNGFAKNLIPRNFKKSEIVNAILSHNLSCQWFAGKGDVELNSPDQGISGTFDLRMRYDSVMVISVRKIGVEGARILINPAEFTILYRLEGLYDNQPISAIKNVVQIDLDYTDIQQMCLGNVIIADTAAMIVDVLNAEYRVKAKSDDIDITYVLDGQNLQIKSIQYIDRSNRIVVIGYGDYREVDRKVSFAYERKIAIKDDKGISTIDLNFEQIEINIPKIIKFSIPPSYEKL